MSSEQRAVVLTNNDPSITYVGEWTTIDGSILNDSGGWGAALSPTLHTMKPFSSFSVPFHGSTISVIGTDNVANLTTDPDPTWECFVDGTSLGSPILQAPIQNNWVMCNDSSLSDDLHELTVNVTSRGMPFYLDTLQYRASPSVSLENTLIAIYPGDPGINFISGWNPLPDLGGNQTSDPNSLVSLTFVGIQLSWYGILPTGPRNTSSGEWSIDGGPSQSFQVTNSIPNTSNSGDNQLFFMTPILDMGSHELSVKYTGTPGQILLTLKYFFVKNGSFPSSLASSTPISPTHTNSTGGTNEVGPHTSNAPSNHVSPVGARKGSSAAGIISGVVGSIVGVAIINFLVWFKICRKRNRGPPFKIIPFQSTLAPRGPLQNKWITRDITQPQPASTPTMVSTGDPICNPINPTPPYTINPASPEVQDGPPPTMPSMPHPPLRVTPGHGLNTVSLESGILLQHEDITHIRPPIAMEEIDEVPPMYTED